jgi:hypothetical protein
LHLILGKYMNIVREINNSKIRLPIMKRIHIDNLPRDEKHIKEFFLKGFPDKVQLLSLHIDSYESYLGD